jgi:hypothetical protein
MSELSLLFPAMELVRTESIATPPLFGPVVFQISSQLDSQKNRFAGCIYVFRQYPVFTSLHLRSPAHVAPLPVFRTPVSRIADLVLSAGSGFLSTGIDLS